ncbi:hypothetical protein [Dysgonomonas sp.]|nr:hypothetical protein [Prevotella sp.]
MSPNKIRNTALVLLLLYIGYVGCVSYFIHSHIYNGVIYVHSHPYNKQTKDADDKRLPFETHHHTSAGFFTYNQLSSLTSLEVTDNIIDEIYKPEIIISYKEIIIQDVISPAICYYNHRAPPYFTLIS